tara:strand:+ start:4650 stop:5654 length:1005 start_codon:yes stop_codon:yes gene_type:complete
MKSKEIAVFIGKFQPPHIGHILTIKKLLLEYEQIVVAITEGKPNIISKDKVISIFDDVLDNKNVTFQPIKGAVDEETAILDFNFDVICSGNMRVLSLLKEQGHKTRFIERTSDNYFTGTSIRDSFINKGIVNHDDDIKEFQIVDTSWLKPIEKVFNSHLIKLEDSILEEDVIKQPLIVDKVTGAVLDGSHRYAFLLKHGYKEAPALMVDYSNESIFVGNELSHRFKHNNNKLLNKDNIRARALNHNLLEPRTTRHFFPFRKIDMPTSLTVLNKGIANDINFLLSPYTIDQQVEANKKYLEEIDEEITIIEEYLKEQQVLKDYLGDHIKKMLTEK